MKGFGLLLIVAGILALVYGGIQYKKERHVIEVGPISATVDEKKSIPIPPLAGALSIIAGVVLVAADRRKA